MSNPIPFDNQKHKGNPECNICGGDAFVLNGQGEKMACPRCLRWHEHNFNLRENGDKYVECTICGKTEPLDGV
jgi:hypothetical protein